jgi:hypothetical protein
MSLIKAQDKDTSSAFWAEVGGGKRLDVGEVMNQLLIEQ